MKFIFGILLLFTLLEASGFEWSAYKETLYVGEPIILIEKFKNNDDKLVKILEFTAETFHNGFDLIFEGDTHKWFPGYFITLSPNKPDTLIIQPKDSVYSYVLLFWKDFGGIERKPPLFPKRGDKCEILINRRDSVFLFFTNPIGKEREIFDVLQDYHVGMSAGERINQFKLKLKKILHNKDYLSPYLYYINKRFESGHPTISKEIIMVNGLKRLFPKHILTEIAEIHLMSDLHADGDPKNKKVAVEMYKELSKKYPSNINLRKEVKVSPETFRTKPKFKRKTLIERFRWEIKKTLRWLKMTYYRLAWKTEYKLRSILKRLKNKGTVRKKDSVVIQLSGLNNIKDCPLITDDS
jgi:hypothetical protein